MATVESKWFSINLTDPWAQRMIGGGFLLVGAAIAVTINREGGVKLVIEGAKKIAPQIIEQAAKAAASTAV